MADSPTRLVRASRAPSSSATDDARPPARLPVWLYLPNLLGYVRVALSAYSLSMVANTVRRRAAATAAAAAASPMQAVVRMASQVSGGVGGLLVSGTMLGRGLDHLIRAVSHQISSSSTKEGTAGSSSSGSSPSSVDSDLLAALLVFALAATLDAVDGHVARAYDQSSALGVVLDVVADNFLRACLWMSAALLDAHLALPAAVFVACEWLTLLASQVVSRTHGGAHWKRQRDGDPWVVRTFFSRGFRNPLGILGIGGLFLAPMWCGLLRHSFPGWLLLPLPPARSDGGYTALELTRRAVRHVFDWMGWVVWAGRLLSLGIECYFIWGLVQMLGDEEEEDGEGHNAQKSKKAS